MGNKEYINAYFSEMQRIAESISVDDTDKAVELLYNAWRDGKWVFICGNGGSASSATHFTCDLVKNATGIGKKGFKAECLNDNIPLILALINDDGFDNLFIE